MSKNDLYNSLKENAPISKKEMGDHLSGRSRLDEASLDNFEKEALDGWASTGTNVNMDNLDKRFISKPNRLPILLTGLAAAGIGAFLLIYYNSTEIKTAPVQATVDKEQLVEETDLYIAEKFDTLIEVKATNSIEVKSLQKHQEPNFEVKKPEIVVEPIEIDKLPLLDVKPNFKKQEIKLEKKRRIKEIYFSNFKLVDYRVMRSAPEIETKQLDLTGTRANQEYKGNVEDQPVWRQVNIPYIDFIEKSMYHMDKLNLKKALARFEVILETYPDDINALFYSGFALYNLGKYSTAAGYFSQILKNEISNFDEEALWYLGLSYEKNGEKSKAKEIFESISKSKSYYAAEALKKI